MHIVLLKCPHVKIAFLKFTSCDNQTLVGCIPIAAESVPLNVKSEKIGQSSHNMYSNNILNFQESTTILNACIKKVWKLIEGTSYLEKWSASLLFKNSSEFENDLKCYIYIFFLHRSNHYFKFIISTLKMIYDIFYLKFSKCLILDNSIHIAGNVSVDLN